MSEKNKSMKTPKCLKMCLMVVSRTSTHSILSAVYCKKRSQFPDFDNTAPVTWSPLHDDKHVADSKGILFSYKLLILMNIIITFFQLQNNCML